MNLLQEIKEYSVMVKTIDGFFKEKYAVNDILRAVREKIISKEGKIYLNGYAEYSFHGIGCRTRWIDKTVNFDYVFLDNIFHYNYFNIFDIMEFLNSRKIEINHDKLKQQIDNLVSQNILGIINNNKYFLLNEN